MNFQTTTSFQSKLEPDVTVKIRVVTLGSRMEYYREFTIRQSNGDGDMADGRATWNTFVLDFDGIMIDGKKPTIDEFFLNGPPELVKEISAEISALVRKKGMTDEQDEAIIEGARRQIVEAEKRIAERKNSEPQSSSGTSGEPGIRIAADASVIPTRPNASDPHGIASENQAASAP